MSNTVSQIVSHLLGFLFVIPALTLHEWAHAYAAYKMGDNTPRMMGRLSLNPLRHIDPLGTVLMPIFLLVITGGNFTFGYAKPVPINPRNFSDYRKGMLITGIAGPAMNVALALLSGVIVRGAVGLLLLCYPFMAEAAVSIADSLIGAVSTFCYLNLVLCFFNLIPIPPFDGSRVVQRFLHGRARQLYNQMERYGIYIVMALVWVLPTLVGFDPLEFYFKYTAGIIHLFLTGGW